jgi:small-conductance mechanosensitive channel
VLINTTVMNYTKKSKTLVSSCIPQWAIGYDTPWRQVEAMLKMAADRTDGLLKDPPPLFLQRTLGDFAITYEVNAYCTDTSRILYYYSKLHENILDVFNEYDVQIMTPNYVLDPQAPKVVSKDNWKMPLPVNHRHNP